MQLASGAMVMTAKLSLPFLLASLVIGLVVSLVQSVTQIQEMTLTFVPKLAAVVLIIALLGHWMLNQMVTYSQQLIDHAATLVGS